MFLFILVEVDIEIMELATVWVCKLDIFTYTPTTILQLVVGSGTNNNRMHLWLVVEEINASV